MVKRLTFFITVITVVALLAPLSAMAAKATPSVTSVKIHRTPSGPSKGALTILATANFSGKAGAVGGRRDTRSLAMIVVTLQGSHHSITASDTVRFTRRNNSGKSVRFDIRIPRSAARLLAGDRGLNVRATVTRELPTVRARALRIDQPGASIRGWRCAEAQANGFTGTCSQFLHILNTPPPAPPVGFQQYQNGTGPGYWLATGGGTYVPGGDEALICVTFWGSGYQYPNWYSIGVNAADGTTIGYVFSPPGESTTVAADGSFSYGSYLDQFVGGYAQVTTGPQLSGSVPTSILSNPVSSSTGPATLNISPQTVGLPVSWSLAALTPNQAAGVC